MNKTELIAAVAEKTGLSKKDSDAAVNAALGDQTVMAQAVGRGIADHQIGHSLGDEGDKLDRAVIHIAAGPVAGRLKELVAVIGIFNRADTDIVHRSYSLETELQPLAVRCHLVDDLHAAGGHIALQGYFKAAVPALPLVRQPFFVNNILQLSIGNGETDNPFRIGRKLVDIREQHKAVFVKVP